MTKFKYCQRLVHALVSFIFSYDLIFHNNKERIGRIRKLGAENLVYILGNCFKTQQFCPSNSANLGTANEDAVKPVNWTTPWVEKEVSWRKSNCSSSSKNRMLWWASEWILYDCQQDNMGLIELTQGVRINVGLDAPALHSWVLGAKDVVVFLINRNQPWETPEECWV